MTITDVEKAERIVEQLNQSHKELLVRSEELSVERAALSFAALAESDGASQAKLKRLNTQAAGINLEIENVASALAGAGKRLVAAQQAEVLEQKRQNAHELRKVSHRFGQLAIDMDETLQKVRELANEMRETIYQINELGSTHPNHMQLQTLGAAAVATALMDTPLKLQHLAPGERRTFCDLAVGWLTMIERNVAQVIGPEQTEEAA